MTAKSDDAAASPLLQLVGVTKAFPAVLANDAVSLDLAPGEICAILGENGAGKSTLVKTIYGVLAPDAGEIRWRGEQIAIRSPAHARALGIGMVFQHFSLFETLTVAENISLAAQEKPAKLVPAIIELGERFGLPVEPQALVHSLSVGERQRVEIIRCLLQDPQLIIMDEPTSVLPPSGIPPLFDTIRKLADQGRAVLFISHKLEEIRSLCHKAVVMRAGKVVATVDPAQETNESLAHLMIGRDIPHPKHDAAKPAANPAMEVRALTYAPTDPFGTTLRDINLALHPGEIVGIAGVSGNGQKELAAILSGETLLPSGRRDDVAIHGEACGNTDSGKRRLQGLAFVPEERNGRGAVPEMNLKKNALLTAHSLGMTKNGLIQRPMARAFAERCIAEMDVRCSGSDAEARSLSGGNLQKYIIGREIQLKPRILIASQPTWGVDVGAAAAIRQHLVDLRDAGVAIMVISEELEELMEIADRLHVIFRGHLSPSVERAQANTALIGDLMTGGFMAQDQAEGMA